MKTILIVGAGKIGSTIASLLASTGDYAVTLSDLSAALPDRADVPQSVVLRPLDAQDDAALDGAMRGTFAVLSAAPFSLTTHIASAAARAGVNYLDLTEDVASTRAVRDLAENAQAAFIPQCGLAPGFVSIVAHDIARKFDRLDTIHLRVGALPEFPTNALGYNLTWSTDGLINEYIEPCEAISEGKRCLVPALEEIGTIGLGGTLYEAFNTSGGLGSLCATYEGRVRELNYRTIRYPGHAAIMKTLLQDLRLSDRREILKDILENALPTTRQDIVVLFVSVTGWKDGRFTQESFARRILGRATDGRFHTAIQSTTAGAICAVLDLLAEEKIPSRGFVRQEDVPLDAFLANRFGNIYA